MHVFVCKISSFVCFQIFIIIKSSCCLFMLYALKWPYIVMMRFSSSFYIPHCILLFYFVPLFTLAFYTTFSMNHDSCDCDSWIEINQTKLSTVTTVTIFCLLQKYAKFYLHLPLRWKSPTETSFRLNSVDITKY